MKEELNNHRQKVTELEESLRLRLADLKASIDFEYEFLNAMLELEFKRLKNK